MGYYKKTNNTTAKYGERSNSVRALQESLNKKGANLKVDSMYGPQTKLAFEKYGGTSDSPTVNTGNEDISRFIRTANPKDKNILNSERKLRDYKLNEPNYGDILDQKRRASQGIIDAIIAQYNKTLEAQGIENTGMNARVRAMNMTSGLGGSDFGTANAVKQENKNQKANDMIIAERDAKINEILTQIDSRADEQYKAERMTYIQSLKDDIEAQKTAKEEDRARAKESIAGLASAGISIDKLKSVDEKSYNTLLEEYGGSQLDLESAWNASLPDDMKTKWTEQMINNVGGKAVFVRYGSNPITKKVEKQEIPTDMDYGTVAGGKTHELNDGSLVVEYPDGSIKRISGAVGGSSSGSKPFRSGKAEFSGEQLSSFSSELENSKTLYGGDGKYVNPEIYEQAYQAWVEYGGLGKDFLLKFPPKKYVNPANTTLPSYLRSSTTKKSSNEMSDEEFLNLLL